MNKKAIILYGAGASLVAGLILLGLSTGAHQTGAAHELPQPGQAQDLQFSYDDALDSIVRDYLKDMDVAEDSDGLLIVRNFGPGQLDGEDFDPKLLFIPAENQGQSNLFASNQPDGDNNHKIQRIHLANLGNAASSLDGVNAPNQVSTTDAYKTEFTAEDYLLATKLTQLENWDPAAEQPVAVQNKAPGPNKGLQKLEPGGQGDGQQFYTKKSVKAKNKKSQKNKKPVYHTVKGGDSLWGISNQYGVSLAALVKLNPDIKGSRIYPGNKVLVKYKTIYHKSKKKPSANYQSKNSPAKSAPPKAKYGYKKRSKYHRVKSGDTLSRLARRYGTSVAALKKRNKLKSSTIYIGQRLFIKTWYKKIEPTLPPPDADYKIVQRKLFTWPVQGRITSRYGFRRDPFNSRRRQFHGGVDIGAAMYTPIKAAGDGIVIYADRKGGYGNTVSIRHPHGFITLYSHMAEMEVKKGDIVKKGQQIGSVGRTGNVTAAHIHFEMKRWLKPVDPVPMFDRNVAVRIPKEEPKSQPQGSTPKPAGDPQPEIVDEEAVKEAKKSDESSKNPS